MSLFRRETDSPPPSPGQPRPAPATPPAAGSRDRPSTRIAEGTRIEGQVTGTTELLVEGELHGEVRLDHRVVVGPAGSVHGRISARSVLVAGRVQGDVEGSERVEVGESGKLEGDIAAPRVTIAEGAFFKGKVEMTGGAGRGRERDTGGLSRRDGAASAAGTGDRAPEEPPAGGGA